MHLWLRLLVALGAAALAGFGGFVAVFWLIASFGSCPPNVHTCDLPMIAEFGLAVIAGPLVGIGTGVWTFSRLSKARTRAVPPST